MIFGLIYINVVTNSFFASLQVRGENVWCIFNVRSEGMSTKLSVLCCIFVLNLKRTQEPGWFLCCNLQEVMIQ